LLRRAHGALAAGLADGPFHVQLVRHAFAREGAQALERHLDVARVQGHVAGEGLVLALLPHLDGAALALARLAHADAFRVVPAAAEGALAARADPLVAAVVLALLLLQPLLEGAQHLLPAPQGLDLLDLLGREHALQVGLEPLLGDLRGEGDEFLRALEEVREGLVEGVEEALVLHQRGAGQVVELVHVGMDDALVHRRQEAQVLLGGDGHTRIAQDVEEVHEHALTRVGTTGGAA